MKKIATICIMSIFLVGFSNLTIAQWVTIPDANFVTYLQTNFGSCMNGNQMDTTCSGITGATYLNCGNKNIVDLYGIQFFDSLDTLYCQNNNLTSINELPPGLIFLNCLDNNITTILELPPTLEYLDCQQNLLNNLPVLPANLKNLIANINYLTSLPSLPATLRYLLVFNNQIISLPVLPPDLLSLNCGINPIQSLPSLPSTLLSLQANYTSLSNLPLLPSTLKTLFVNNCLLDSLTALPPSITSLSFGNPGFIVTPILPPNLETLTLEHSDLTTLPTFPNSLIKLDLRENDVVSNIPILPSNLEWLTVINNDLIQTIPDIPNTVTFLSITNSNVMQIPELPDSIGYCYLDNNPMLYCLPKLKRINYFSWQNTSVNCIPNYGHVTQSQPPLSAFPVCDIFNSNACDFYLNIAGKVYADNNTNCNDDPGESVSNSVKINLYQSGNLIQQNVTLPSGQYDFEVPLGTYTYSVDTTNMPFEVLCPPSGEHQSILTALDSVDLNMDFGLQCKIQDDLGIHTIVQDSGIFRPTQTTLLNVIAGDIAQVYNLNCASGTSGTVTVFFAGPAQFAGIFPGSEVPVVAPNSLTYTIADFGAIDIYNAFKFYMTTDTNTLGIPDVCFTVNVTLLSGDLNPLNNTYTHCFTIWNSFDPNFKEANPVNIIANTAEWLTYTIHFQNTGNAPALNIVISDTLDAKLQESTFTYLQSSHDVFTQVIGNVIKFNFPNINLPDSTNDEPNSHGYVQYKVKIDPGLNVGQTIQNTAAIYFDFNAPIITNTTTNLVVAPTGISEGTAGNYQLIPNPAKNYFHIVSGNNSIQQISIFDISGKIVKEIRDYKSGERIDTSNLDAGMYLVKVQNDQYIHTSKLILN